MLDKRDNFDDILKRRYDDFHADVPAWNELFTDSELASIQPQRSFLYRRSLTIVSSVAAIIAIGIILSITFSDKSSNFIEQTATIAKNDTKTENHVAVITHDTTIVAIAKIKDIVQYTQPPTDTTKLLITISEPQTITNGEISKQKQSEQKAASKDTKQKYNKTRSHKESIKRKTGKLSLLATTSLTPSIGSSQSSGVMAMYDSPITVNINSYRSSINFEKDDYKHKFPVNVAFLVRYEVANKLSISGGLNYCYLESSAQKVEKLTYSLKQRVNYLGVPLALNYDFLEAKRFSMYGSIGAMVEFNISSSKEINSYSKENLIKTQKDKIKIKEPLFSLQAGVGLRYNIVDDFGIFVEPGINYVFSSYSQPISYKTNTPMQFNLKIGLSIDF